MNIHAGSLVGSSRRFAFLVCVLGSSAPALASTITQNTSWTIDRAGTSTKYRVTAYGDSIFAGYNGGLFSVARRAGPMVTGEYASAAWNTDIEVVRRTKSGAVASDIYNSKIVSDRSYMQSTNTRVVMFEMCGNDYLQARSSFKGQTGTCNYSGADAALANCTNYTGLAMDYINANAYSGTKLKVVSNIYYPGYNADNVLSGCTDATTGAKVKLQDKFLDILAHSNWRTCNLAAAKGFACADSFAQFMASDADGPSIAYVQGESESAYVTRITVTNRALLRDSNTHFADASTSYDYLQSDDTHPTYTGSTIGLNIFTGSGSGTGAPDYPTNTGGKNAIWNHFGHERMGWNASAYLPATP